MRDARADRWIVCHQGHRQLPALLPEYLMHTEQVSGAPAQPSPSGWPAQLRLRFERRHDTRTVLALQRHEGPLLVQKALYPEDEQCCHAILLHPPAGIVAGDLLSIDVTVDTQAHALLTTPGASKWYRSSGPLAQTDTRLQVGSGAALEWLPREAIVFEGARACARLKIELAEQARCVGWEIWCLGRTACGERFDTGCLQVETRLASGGRPRWEERGRLEGGSALLSAAAGLADQPVFGTLWAAGLDPPAPLLERCRAVRLEGPGRGAVTQLPELLLARYLGPSTEEAFTWLSAIWSLVRPHYVGRAAVRPRIWAV
jgi:urease accessory protein